MKTLTTLSTLLLILLVGATAQAQDKEVTFEFDATALMDQCQFVPAEGDIIAIRGSFNGWNEAGQDTLVATGTDNIFATTINLPEGDIAFKLYLDNDPEGTSEPGWEDGGDRTYSVTGDEEQTVTLSAYNKALGNACPDAESADIALTFGVLMDVQRNAGNFDPASNEVTIAGSFQGWDNTADPLEADFFNQDLYTKTFFIDDAALPYTVNYKFVIQPGDGWESISDRAFTITPEMVAAASDEDGDGYLDFVADLSPDEVTPHDYFNMQDPSTVLSQDVMLTLEVDARPAYYFLADSSSLPNTAENVTDGKTIEDLGIFVNGPLRGGWAEWGELFLGASTTDRLRDDGQGGDAVAGDSIYTWQKQFTTGQPKGSYMFKMSAGGPDNEADFGQNHTLTLEGTGSTETVRVIFGANYTDAGDLADDFYDPYIAVDAGGNVSVVRRGGAATSVEEISLPSGYTLAGNFPNPFTGSTAFTYSIGQAEHVRVRIYDVTGRVVATLVDGLQPAATYRVTFEARDLAAGLYLYRLETPSTTLTQKMLLVK